MFAFEVTGALLITAALGAMVLAHRERTTPRLTQRELSERGFRGGQHPAPLPGPGVSTPGTTPSDTPALLPDGSRAPSVACPGAQRRAATAVERRRRARAPRSSASDRAGRPGEPDELLYLSALLFSIGAIGVLLRRNAIVVFMCVELMLNATNLAFVTFARMHGTWTARSSRSSSWWSPRPRSSSAWRSS